MIKTKPKKTEQLTVQFEKTRKKEEKKKKKVHWTGHFKIIENDGTTSCQPSLRKIYEFIGTIKSQFQSN